MLIEEFKNNNGTTEACSFCGEREPSGIWMGEKVIFCCKFCAINYLPQLMADAIVDGTTEEQLKDKEVLPAHITNEKHILSRFHGAFSSALIRKIRQRA